MWCELTPGANVVLDATGPLGQFASKLLRDLGTTVVPLARELAGGLSGRDVALDRAQTEFLRGDHTTTPVQSLADGLAASACVLWDETSTVPRAELDRAVERARTAGWSGSVVRIAGVGGGPYGAFRTDDMLLNAIGGITFVSGSPDAEPCTPPETQGYYFASAWTALVTMADMYAAAVGRERHDAEVVAYEAVATQEQIVRSWGSDGEIIRREGSQHKRVSPASIYAAADGYVYLMVSKVHWRTFLRAWDDHPVELDDEVWESNEHRRARASTLNRLLAPFVARSTVDDFVTTMQRVGIPCLPVYTPRQLTTDRHMRARPLFVRSEGGQGTPASLRLPLVWSPPDCVDCRAEQLYAPSASVAGASR